MYTSELDEYILANTPFRREYREQVLKYMEQTSHISILSSHHSHDLKSLTEGVYIRFP